MTSQQYNKILTTINSVTSNYSFTPDLDNVIVIDTSNNRIGINTANPECSIDVSNGKIKTENLTILGDASINNIKNLYINNDSAIDNGMYLNNNKILYYDNNLLKLDSSNIRILGNVIFENAPTFSSGDVTTTTSADTGGGFIYNTSIGINSNGGIDPSGGYFTFLNLINNTQSIDTGTGALVVNGGAGIARNLNVGGDASINNILEVSNNLLVKGNSKLENNLDVGGDASINNILEVSNNLLVKGNSKLENNLDVSTVTVTGNTTINGTLIPLGGIDFNIPLNQSPTYFNAPFTIGFEERMQIPNSSNRAGAMRFGPTIIKFISNREEGIGDSGGYNADENMTMITDTAVTLNGGPNGANLFSGNAGLRVRGGSIVYYTSSQPETTLSDDRYKSRTVDCTADALSLIQQVRVREFKEHVHLRVEEGVEDTDLSGVEYYHKIGVVAQELEKIPGLEWLVKEFTDGIIHGDTNPTKAVSYDMLNIYLLRAVQQLADRVAALEAR